MRTKMLLAVLALLMFALTARARLEELDAMQMPVEVRAHMRDAESQVRSRHLAPLSQGPLAYTAVHASYEAERVSRAIPQSITDTVVLHEFTHGADGSFPTASLIRADDGTLYGTTFYGGRGSGCGILGCGTVFRMNQEGTSYGILYAFNGGSDGAHPRASLLQASDGFLYGTTYEGGFGCGGAGCGTVFRIGADGSDYETIYAFRGGDDGALPTAPLIQASDGLLYGTTIAGGVSSPCATGCGTVFRIALDGTSFSVPHAFTADDGISPVGGVIQASDGYLYGTTSSLGPGGGSGTVFRMDLDGVGVDVLHVFSGYADGSTPYAGLIEASDGVLYGTTAFGGRFLPDDPATGTVFRITRDGSGYRRFPLWESRIASPYAPLSEASDGNFYSTTLGGSLGTGPGSVFRITPEGGITVLLRFSGGEDGAEPLGGLVQGEDGSFFGTTSKGGRPGLGLVFRLTVMNPEPGAVRASNEYPATG